MRKISRDVGIALAGIILTILFDFFTVAFVDPGRFEELKKDQTKLTQFLAVPFDLWIVSFSLLFGAAVTLEGKDRGKLTWPIVGTVAVLIVTLASLALSAVVPTLHGWLAIYIPDLLGFALVGYAAHSAMEGP